MLWKMLREAASAAPDKVIFSEGQTDLRLGELRSKATGLARRLSADGVQPGDAVGLLVRGGCRTAACIYGVLAAGAVVVPLNPASRRGEVERALGPCRPKMALCEPDLAHLVEGVAPRVLTPHDALSDLVAGDDWPGPELGADDP